MASRSVSPCGNEPALSLRRVVLLIWATILVLTPYERLAALPPVMFDPVGVAALLVSRSSTFDELVRYDVLLSVRVIGVLALCTAICVHRPRFRCASHSVAFASVVMLDSVTKSASGYVNHAQAIPLIVLALVTASQVFDALHGFWLGGARARRDADPQVPSTDEFEVWASGVTIVIAYTFTGVNRIVYGQTGVGGDAILTQMLLASHQYSAFGFQITPVVVDTVWGPALLRAGFAGVTALEVLSAGVFCREWFRRLWLLSMSGFHVSALFLMNIFFWENVLLIWVVFGRRELDATARALGGAFQAMRR